MTKNAMTFASYAGAPACGAARPVAWPTRALAPVGIAAVRPAHAVVAAAAAVPATANVTRKRTAVAAAAAWGPPV